MEGPRMEAFPRRFAVKSVREIGGGLTENLMSRQRLFLRMRGITSCLYAEGNHPIERKKVKGEGESKTECSGEGV